MIYDSQLWIEDIEKIIVNFPELDRLNGKTILITGIGGLICSAVADILIQYNEIHNGNINILAAGRSPEKITNRFGIFENKSYFHYIKYDAINSKSNITESANYIIHGASNAFPSLIVKEPVETMLSNISGLLGLLNYAREKGSSRLLYISSSEIYGRKDGKQPYRENEYGYIDLLNSRNSYSIGKRAAETLCSSYSDEYGIDTVIVRPGHIYGPTASSSDNRVSSMWAYSVAHGNDIIMKSNGEQIRSYCYCLDCASAILRVLLYGRNKHAYNISNPDSVITIKYMAEILAKSAGVQLKIELPTEEEKKGFNPMLNSSLDSVNLQKLGWKGFFNAETGFSHTVQIIKDSLSFNN